MKIQVKPMKCGLLRRQMQRVDQPIDIAEVGTVLSVGDGIARADGLSRSCSTSKSKPKTVWPVGVEPEKSRSASSDSR